MNEAPVSDWSALHHLSERRAFVTKRHRLAFRGVRLQKEREQQLMHTDADFASCPSCRALLFNPERGFNEDSPLPQNALRALNDGAWPLSLQSGSKHCIYLALPTTDARPLCAGI